MLKPVLVLTLVAGLPAQAGLTVCNKAKSPATVALGRFDGRDWASQGWWTIAPGACAGVIKTKLDARYYYLYGSDAEAGIWDGSTSFCVSSKAGFAISGRGNCAARGYDRKRFFRIDTGNDLNHTQNLQ